MSERQINMTDENNPVLPDEVVEAELEAERSESESFARTLSPEEISGGDWFIKLLRKVTSSYNRNARAAYFQTKYPGLHPDDVADKLIMVATRYSMVIGGVTGLAASATQAAAVGTLGTSLAVTVTSLVTEMVTLAALQMRLLLDLSVIYDLQLNEDDPEDLLMIFGYALGVAPQTQAGKLTETIAGNATKQVIRNVVKKDVNSAFRNATYKLIGKKIGQKALIKYGVPVVSIAVGSGYNYLSTKILSSIAKAHFRTRGQVNDELRKLVSRKNTYALVIPAAVYHVSNLDSKTARAERDLYKAMLSRMTIEDHTPEEFEALSTDQNQLLNLMSQLDDDDKSVLLNLLTMMVICDGELNDKERDFLTKSAQSLNLTLDMPDIERRALEFRKPEQQNVFKQAAGSLKNAASKFGEMIGRGEQQPSAPVTDQPA